MIWIKSGQSAEEGNKQEGEAGEERQIHDEAQPRMGKLRGGKD